MPPPSPSAVVVTFKEASKNFSRYVDEVFQEFAGSKCDESGRETIEISRIEDAASALFNKAQIQLTDVQLEGIKRGASKALIKEDFHDVGYEVLQDHVAAELSLSKKRREELLAKCAAFQGFASRDATPSDRPALDRIPDFTHDQKIYIMDVGTTEVGFYIYERTGNAGIKPLNTKKVPMSFLDECISEQKTDKIVKVIQEEYGSTDVKVNIGFTGANRERYLKERGIFDTFFELLVREIPNLTWFILSGTTEARSEFRAVQFLAEKLGFGKVDGVVGAGGGSCQVSTSTNLFSIPVGNKTPEKEPPVGATSQDKIYSWILKVGLEIAKNHITPIPGSFVGISAVYHAAKAAEIAGSTVTKNEAIKAFDVALAKAIAANDARTMYNLTLVRTVLSVIIMDGEKIFFQRNWRIGEDDFVASWTLGLIV